MRKSSGITMITLVLTVIILFILSTITVRVSTEAYTEVKVQNFITKLKVIQAKVDSIVEDEKFDFSGFTKLEDLPAPERTSLEEIIDGLSNNENSWSPEDNNKANYYFFTPEDLQKKLSLKDQEMTVLINFKTRNVISTKGLKLDGKLYFRQYDLSGGDQLK